MMFRTPITYRGPGGGGFIYDELVSKGIWSWAWFTHLLSHGQNFCRTNMMVSVNMAEKYALEISQGLPDAA